MEQSSLIQQVTYWVDLQVLDIKFKDGSGWRYRDVLPDVYDGLENAYSKGRYYNRFIKGKYVSSKENIDEI